MKRIIVGIFICLLINAIPASAQSNHWHYPFDGDCADIGPNGQAGTASPGVAFVEGHKGGCARFGGSDFVALPLDFNQTAELSFCFWMKLEGAQPGPYYAMLISSDADTFGRGVALSLENGNYQVWLDDRFLYTDIPPPASGVWQHVCVTYAPGTVKLYLDGQEAYSHVGYTNALPFNDSTNVLVGLRNFFFDRGANASIDELEIFDRAISAEEVSELAYDGQTLLAYYRFEDDTLDSSLNAYHGIPSTNLNYENSIHGRGLVLPPEQYVTLPINLNPYGAISFSFWMKINGAPDNPDYGMFFSTDNNTFGRGLGMNTADSRFMMWYDDAFEYSAVAVPKPGLWKHVGMTYAPGYAAFYIDGQCVHTTALHTNTPPYNDAANITLGLRNLFMDRGADFSIDELRIYNRTLSSNEMLSIFEMGLTVTGIVVEGTSVIGPDRSSPFSCYAYSANGQRIDVTAGATFSIETPDATNDAWFVGNVLHSGAPAADRTIQVSAGYEHVSGTATSSLHDVWLRADEPDCLLAYYPLDGNAYDASGNAQDGTIYGAVSSTDAVAGSCFRFNGANTISLPIDQNTFEEFSFSLWFKLMGTQPGPYYAMLLSSDRNTFGRGMAITLTNSNFQIWYDTDWEDTGTHTPTVGEWHHLAATYSPGNNVFYFDGVETYRDASRAHPTPYNDATDLLLGMRNYFFDRGFNGEIDEVKIYGCALSSNAVWSEYMENAGGTVNEPPVIQVPARQDGDTAPCKVVFDFSASQDPDGWIVRSEVDQEGDGIFEQAVDGAGLLSVDYLRPNDYQTVLRVIDNYGAMATTSAWISVLGAAPVVVLQANPDSGDAPLDVAFEALATPADTNRPIVSYEWDFDGDGVMDLITSSAEVRHTFGQAGDYAVSVSAIDIAGVAGRAGHGVLVSPSSFPPDCSPSLEFFPHTGFAPLGVQLCVQGATNCDYTEIAWDFEGNGLVDAVTTAATASNLYADPGKYWPSASVFFEDGSVIVLTNLLQISESSALKVWIAQPHDGQVVAGSAVSLRANTAPGNLTSAVRFQYRPSDASEWTDIGDWLESPSFSFDQDWDVSAFPAGTTVFLRALALDIHDIQVISDTLQVQIESSATNALGAVEARDDQILFNVDASRRCQYRDADGLGFSITPQTLADNQLIVVDTETVPVSRAIAPSTGKTFLPNSYGLDLGDAPLDKPVQLFLPYADEDGDGFIDGSDVPELTLDAYVREEPNAAWHKAARTDIDPVANIVRTEISESCEVRLAGNPSLLLPCRGCALAIGGQPAADARALADGNANSSWQIAPEMLPCEILFAFTNDQIAVVRQFSLLNAGASSGSPLKSFRIETSLDGVDYVACVEAALAAADEMQDFGALSATCRYVKLVALDAYGEGNAQINEISAYGALSTDSDLDGLDDAWELRYFPSLSGNADDDQDGDGLTTGTEAQLGLNPAQRDTDGDGFSDYSEWVAGTSGTDPGDLFTVRPDSSAVSGQYLLNWLSKTGRVYSVLSSTNLLGSWADVPAYVVQGDGTVKYFTNSAATDAGIFYRLKVTGE